jgi:hypothetical protein
MNRNRIKDKNLKKNVISLGDDCRHTQKNLSKSKTKTVRGLLPNKVKYYRILSTALAGFLQTTFGAFMHFAEKQSPPPPV